MSGSASSYYSCLCPRCGSAGWEGRTDGMPGPGRLPRRRGTYPGLVSSISPTSPRMSYQRAMRILFRARPANQIIPNSQTCSSTCDANTCKARWRRRPIVCLAALPRLSILQSRRMIQSDIEGSGPGCPRRTQCWDKHRPIFVVSAKSGCSRPAGEQASQASQASTAVFAKSTIGALQLGGGGADEPALEGTVQRGRRCSFGQQHCAGPVIRCEGNSMAALRGIFQSTRFCSVNPHHPL